MAAALNHKDYDSADDYDSDSDADTYESKATPVEALPTIGTDVLQELHSVTVTGHFRSKAGQLEALAAKRKQQYCNVLEFSTALKTFKPEDFVYSHPLDATDAMNAQGAKQIVAAVDLSFSQQIAPLTWRAKVPMVMDKDSKPVVTGLVKDDGQVHRVVSNDVDAELFEYQDASSGLTRAAVLEKAIGTVPGQPSLRTVNLALMPKQFRHFYEAHASVQADKRKSLDRKKPDEFGNVKLDWEPLDAALQAWETAHKGYKGAVYSHVTDKAKFQVDMEAQALGELDAATESMKHEHVNLATMFEQQLKSHASYQSALAENPSYARKLAAGVKKDGLIDSVLTITVHYWQFAVPPVQ
jgi:hypothetical protein